MILKLETDNYAIQEDAQLLTPEAIENVKSRGEYVADWIATNMLSQGSVLSIGCGLGFDVAKLSQAKFDAYGIEPIDRSAFWEQTFPHLTDRFAVASDRNIPWPDKTFSFIAAFEVIEHVGTVDNDTLVGPDTRARRVEFLRNAISRLEPGGRLLLTCPNRMFPFDFGHAHHDFPMSEWIFDKVRLTPTIPWSSRNFLVAPMDVRSMLAEIPIPTQARFLAEPSFFSFGRSQGKWVRKIPIKAFLACEYMGKLLPSAAPHLLAIVTRA